MQRHETDSSSLYSNRTTVSRLSHMGRPKFGFGEGSFLHRNLTNLSLTEESDTIYQLEKVETNASIESGLISPPPYKVSLRLNKNEIEMIRFTWNKMLLDDPVDKQDTPKVPGAYPEKAPPKVANTSAQAIASSLFCRQFYGNLLSMSPDLEKMFPSIRHQAVSFAGVMAMAINQLEDLSTMDDYMLKLGKRHNRILGIGATHFELMGEALILTFHERFGIRFTQELEVLWIKLYLYLANTLLQFGLEPVLRPESLPTPSGFEISQTRTFSTGSSLMQNNEERASVNTNGTSIVSTDHHQPLAQTPTHAHTLSFQTSNYSLQSKTPKSETTTKKKRDCVVQ
ncbi:globin-like protein [Scheffersomyces xylosifermentans]|uniref:globin-like protein n=1 Tax=Scheffersomyces xylosifermentans TaxID=1304137 RepID=UPI00315DCF60